ncbi:ATP-dependent nuclease [Rhodoferax sp.]|uniref:ATP-dependent nuclease n=1 Tax=Rhodoferax sp. TaxID=50421 RepID=UPI002773B90B|nr:AAA family ATPase [Rhodoferax sp.]
MKLEKFKVTNYRNVLDSGWIETGDVTAFVGQNEAGKSNLFEALCRINSINPGDKYDINEDWPVDAWGDQVPSALVCEAKFKLSSDDCASLYTAAGIPQSAPVPAAPPPPVAEAGGEAPAEQPTPPPPPVLPQAPDQLILVCSRGYGKGGTRFAVEGNASDELDSEKVQVWSRKAVPKFVYIHDYELSGAQIELPQLAEKLKGDWNTLTNEEQTISIVLDLAKIKIAEFLQKGESADGRTIRSFDKRAASVYLSKQFRELWRQKKVDFDIEIDGPTLNIFARDEAVGMPVRLHRRSSGFRWHVSFAWKFTHASQGQYKGCILLLEEPGIHLHYSGQKDLLALFERLSADNTILFTTHLASMVDLANPERIRIVESKDNHTVVKKGVVSSQRAPAAVIEMALGLTGDLSGLLGSRQTLIVEGGDESLVLNKLSGFLRSAKKAHLSERIYLWPAHGAPNTPMYAALAVGHGWDAGVLLDSDGEGRAAAKKINEMVLKDVAAEQKAKFRVLLLGEAAAIDKPEAAIEDLFGDKFYIDCVNAAFGLGITEADLPSPGPPMITKRIEQVVTTKYGHKELDRRAVMREILRRFDNWKTVGDLPDHTLARAERLFAKINGVFQSRAA